MFKEFVFPAWAKMATAGGRHRRRRTTDRGRLLQTGTIICLALGIDTDLNLIYQMFALLVSLIIVSRLSLRFDRPNVSVRRRLPRYATAGEPFTYYIDVDNQGERVEADLRVVDNPVMRAPTIEEYRREREPGEETRNAWDRFIGFHRFMYLMRMKTGLTTRGADLPNIGIRARVSAAIEATPLRRGVVHFRETQVMHPDPMGFNHGIITFDAPGQLTVLPRRYVVGRHIRLPGGRHFQPGGVNSTWSVGESDEFASLRDYRDGDSPRKIHWPSSAKRNKPVVREFQEEYLVRQALVLESETENVPVLEEAISLAASLIMKESQSESMLDLVYFADHPEIISSGRAAASGTTSVNRQLEALAVLAPARDSLEPLAQAAARHAAELSGAIIILTSWDDAREAFVETIRRAGISAEVLIVADAPAGVHAKGARVLDARDMSTAVAEL